MNQIVNVGIIGFGLSGRYFFTPFIAKNPKYKLAAVVTSQAALVESEYPGTKVYSTIDELFADSSIDLIIVASPNSTHFDYSKKALYADKHIIVEKPFTITSGEAEELIKIASEKKKILAPFQNRRWDGDFLTVNKLIAENALGEVLEFESHFDRFRPLGDRVEWKNVPSPGSGVLYDLGPHLIDQALVLFGKPEYIYGDIRVQREQGKVDDNFEVQMHYSSGLKVILKAGVFVRELGPRFKVNGRKGSFVKFGLDPQENNLRTGMMPDNSALGVDDEALFGVLNTEIDGVEVCKTVPTTAGNYMAYFDNVYDAVTGKSDLIVKPEQAKQIIEVIETAYRSSSLKQVLPF